MGCRPNPPTCHSLYHWAWLAQSGDDGQLTPLVRQTRLPPPFSRIPGDQPSAERMKISEVVWTCSCWIGNPDRYHNRIDNNVDLFLLDKDVDSVDNEQGQASSLQPHFYLFYLK